MDSTYEKFKELLSPGHIINLENIETRKGYLCEMEELQNLLKKAATNIAEKLENAKSLHAEEIARLDKALNGLKKPNERDVSPTIVPATANQVPWSKIAASKPEHTPGILRLPMPLTPTKQAPDSNGKKEIVPARQGVEKVKASTEGFKAANITTVKSPDFVGTRYPNGAKQGITSIHIIGNFFIDAYKVENWREVKADGNLYYVDSAEHFAFALAGMLFHGNIGNIFLSPGSGSPRIRDCRYGNGCNKQVCTYYHDPIHFPGKKDIRNYVNNSRNYLPSTSATGEGKQYCKFGSRDCLEADINMLSEEEAKRFMDRVMHDFLCAMILKNYYHSR